MRKWKNVRVLTLTTKMTIKPKKIEMIIQGEDQSRLCPERDIWQPKLPSYHWWPHEKSVRNQTTNSWLCRLHNLLHRLLRMRRIHVQQGGHELVVVERAVELHGEAVGDGGVAYVEAGVAGGGEDVIVGVGFGFGSGGVVVDVLGVDEGDGEASWR